MFTSRAASVLVDGSVVSTKNTGKTGGVCTVTLLLTVATESVENSVLSCSALMSECCCHVMRNEYRNEKRFNASTLYNT